MKLQPDKSHTPLISAHGRGWVEVAGKRYEQSLILCSGLDTEPTAWRPSHYDELTSQDFAVWPVEDPELIIFGSGAILKFPQIQWTAHLFQKRIGFETMDTAAACRTYNILASEGRNVVAALLMEKP